MAPERDILTFFTGMVSTGYLACGLFFLRFWSRSRDFLFLAFAAAFWLLALNVIIVVLIPEPEDTRSWFYLIRLVAYVLIAAAIVRKNVADGED